MTYLLISATIVFNLICVVRQRKSKIVTAFSIVSLSLIFGGNNLNADYDAYLLNYKLVASDSSYFNFDPFFNILMKVGSSLNLEYNVFLTIVCLILYTLLFAYLFKRNDYKIHSIILLYVIYSFFIDAIQVSNFISNVFAIIFVSIMLEYREQKKKRLLLLSVLILVLAVGFHSSSLVLIPFYLFSNSRKTNAFAVFAVLFACIDTVMGHAVVNFIFGIVPYLGAYAALSFYSARVNTGFGFLLYLLIVLILIGLVKYYDEENNKGILNFLQYILVLTPIMVISTISFTRFFRVMTVAYSGFYNKLEARHYKRDLFVFSVFLVVMVFLFFREIGFENVRDIMNNNYFFN